MQQEFQSRRIIIQYYKYTIIYAKNRIISDIESDLGCYLRSVDMEIAVNYFGPHHSALLHYAQELGIRHAVCTVAAVSDTAPAYFKPWDEVPLRMLQLEIGSLGMDISVLEGIKFIDSAKLGTPDKDRAINDFCRLLENMSRLGIRTVCYNWMPVWGWFRTRKRYSLPGGSVSTAFFQEDIGKSHSGLTVSEDELWANLEYFMKKVVPVAEKHRINLALHPDDPPVPDLCGVSRILITPDNMMKAIDLVPSEYNGITMCQGTFRTMGADVPAEIRRFSERIHFAHMRDIQGSPSAFYETFPDNGSTDMVAAIKAYKEIGFDGVIRPDHTPTMYGENNDVPGYAVLGNLFTIGYLRGLMEACE